MNTAEREDPTRCRRPWKASLSPGSSDAPREDDPPCRGRRFRCRTGFKSVQRAKATIPLVRVRDGMKARDYLFTPIPGCASRVWKAFSDPERALCGHDDVSSGTSLPWSWPGRGACVSRTARLGCAAAHLAKVALPWLSADAWRTITLPGI
jgi:hypothetical protein